MSTITVTPKFISLSNARSIYTERRTASSNPTQTILFIHGLGGTADVFYPIYSTCLVELPQTTLLSYTWLGTVDDKPVILATLVEEIEAILFSEVPTGPIVIIAHSAGTQLATSFITSDSPVLQRVSHVVLIAGPLDLPFPDEVVAKQENLASLLATDGQQGLIDSLLSLFTGKTTMESRPLAAALVRAAAMVVHKESYAAAIRAFARGAKAPAKYDFSKIPEHVKVLIVGGGEDTMVPPEKLQAVTGKIKGAGYISLFDSEQI